MKIPHSSPWITSEDITFVTQRLKTGVIAKGNMVTQFEKECGEYLKQKYLIATSSGQSALILALQVLKIKGGDEVILPSYCCQAVEDAVLAVGAVPVFCDITQNWCVTAETISTVITPKTKAIIAVHTFGIQCNMEPICDLGIPVIEDCCQYFYKDAGKFGQISVFSFHATKCLTTGEGGMVTSNQPLNVENNLYIMSDLQAALGIIQLKRYSEMLDRRNAIADRYNKALVCQSNARSMYFRYPLIVEAGHESIAPQFEKEGISVRRGVDALLHRKNGLSDEYFPNTVDQFNKTISIPLYPALSDEAVQKIIDTAVKVLS